ncbi:MAG: hypothetical protein ACOYO1_09600 [Bacteroidales bacterium]
MKNIICIIFIVGITFLVACRKDSTTTSTSNLYTPASADVTANATLAELQQGRELYINNCGSCHNLYSPDSYTPTAWKTNIAKMSPKTSMNAAKVSLVTKYVCRGKQ